ncbi:hypothetical protein OCGS_2124 [Oceaniovalibus guishaninsula JLT2003]|uniref:FlgN family protein n=1 Tax=Oceaniovalibus guishaninsula JLT2003 TaxID=1231392 RepID=K2I4H8_9RHOB|nr:hypothetical protein [Oceaniovalibus guishaninsula]EKE43790.1 hypothetical protein OCGS_2124 [Oceaniovalibus guishaninsula JLT2003]
MRRNRTDLARLLEDERAALLKGDFAALSRLEGPKERAIDALADLSAAEIEAIGAKAALNQQLLQAAMRGIAAARDRLAAIRDGAQVATYDTDGTVTKMMRVPPTLQRRY